MEVWIEKRIYFTAVRAFGLMKHHLLTTLVAFMNVNLKSNSLILKLLKCCKSIILISLILSHMLILVLIHSFCKIVWILIISLAVTSSLKLVVLWTLLIDFLKHRLLLPNKYRIIHHIYQARVSLHRLKLQIFPLTSCHSYLIISWLASSNCRSRS